MKKHLIAALCTMISMVQIINIDSYALSMNKEIIPLEEGISLLDTSGKIYFHIENQGALNISLDKIEPEGVFRFYNTNIRNEKSTNDTIYYMLLSHCEYLVDSSQYASYYNLNISSSMDDNSYYNQNITIKDPDFENISESEYHFYITMKPSDNSGYKVLSSNEYISSDNIFISEQYIELDYLNLGDVNGNGRIDIQDAVTTLNIYALRAAGMPVDDFTEAQIKNADINSDGKVNASDATEILRIYAENAAGI